MAKFQQKQVFPKNYHLLKNESKIHHQILRSSIIWSDRTFIINGTKIQRQIIIIEKRKIDDLKKK